MPSVRSDDSRSCAPSSSGRTLGPPPNPSWPRRRWTAPSPTDSPKEPEQMTIAPPLEQRPLDIPPFERPAESPPVRGRTSWTGRVLRGRPEDPGWVRPGLLALLVVTAGLYLWDLSAQG